MARRWTEKEETVKRKELQIFYVKENKNISDIGKILGLAESSVYDRLIRLDIKPNRSGKIGFNNKRHDLLIPKTYSKNLSELIGVLLGDGHITPTQVTVTLGNKEDRYVKHVLKLINRIFRITPKIIRSKHGYHVVYFGSTVAVRWLLSMGLVFNKVKNQVDIPGWIFQNNDYLIGFLKGFFDTDGSIYKLKFGMQIAFTNRSLPLLKSTRRGLISLGYYPSQISKFRIYLTRRKDVIRFFKIVNPSNTKHIKRFKLFTESDLSQDG